MRSLFNLIVVLAVYFAGTAANTGDKAQSSEKPSPVIKLKDGRTVYKNAEDVKPVKAGLVPDVSIRDADGQTVQLRELASEQPLLLVVYRGGWCPYCNRQLAGLQEIVGQVKKRGYRVVGLSADRPAKIKQALEKKSIDYSLYSDSSMEASIAFGLAFQVPDKLVKTYKESYNIDLEDASGEKHHYLPVPAVYVIGKDGQIKFAHANADYKVRLSNEEVLAAL
ncbi:MAG: AhpC/TSA family protein [Bdellovibrionales bacterium]|nr:AhpC/TSA family protein [Bdellovibrionales bacterium]